MTSLLKNNAVYLHIPKTGGTWVYAVLTALGLVRARLGHEHADLLHAAWHDRFCSDAKLFRHLLRRFARSSRAPVAMPLDSFKFCFVREPIKWYESYWRFMQTMDWQAIGDEAVPIKWHPNAMLNGLGSPDFNTFMANVLRKRPGYVTEMYGWYTPPNIDFVGKQENLTEDLAQALTLMKVDFDPAQLKAMPVINESPSKIPKPEWDPKLKRQTLLAEYAGYVRFGYPFPEIG
jgi:hypothetical protein